MVQQVVSFFIPSLSHFISILADSNLNILNLPFGDYLKHLIGFVILVVFV